MSHGIRKYIIGLTGNIATGKSAVLKMAAEEGALTLDADQIVHHILDNDPSMQAAIAVAFGEHVRRNDGAIDRAALGAIVFDDEQALRDLENLVHPAVRVEISRRMNASEANVVMVEAIKLLEGDLAALCDEIWVTRCPRSLQQQRLMICRGMDEETATTRIAAQNPQEAKIARAHVVIDTDGPLAHTRTQFDRAWQRLPVVQAAQETGQQVEARTPATDTETSQPVEAVAPVDVSADDMSADDGDVIVRRARPSDIPALMLLMRKASDGRVQQTRAEMLMSFAERSYLIGQVDTDVVCIVGWNTDSTTAVCVDQLYAVPAEAIDLVGPPMLREIERSAQELICEVVLVFLAPDAPPLFKQLLQSAGYSEMGQADMHRAWRQVIEERQPQGGVVMGKVLRDIRVG